MTNWLKRLKLRGAETAAFDHAANALRRRYLDVVKSSLLNQLYPELEAQLLHGVLCIAHRQPVELDALWAARSNAALLEAIAEARAGGDTLVLRGVDERGEVVDRVDLRNHTEFAHTMIGRARLEHLQWCCETALADGVPGDFLEAGVWRGGACVLMSAVLAAHADASRKVWIADSFQGVPPPSLEQDRDLDLSARVLPVLCVSESEVRDLLHRYDVFDDQRIRFIKGWFGESLPGCAVQQLAVLRIDGDLYESTRDALVHLYPKLAPGGFVIIDDYGILPPCQIAVDEFRAANGIDESMQQIDGHAVYWRRRSTA